MSKVFHKVVVVPESRHWSSWFLTCGFTKADAFRLTSVIWYLNHCFIPLPREVWNLIVHAMVEKHVLVCDVAHFQASPSKWLQEWMTTPLHQQLDPIVLLKLGQVRNWDLWRQVLSTLRPEITGELLHLELVQNSARIPKVGDVIVGIALDEAEYARIESCFITCNDLRLPLHFQFTDDYKMRFTKITNIDGTVTQSMCHVYFHPAMPVMPVCAMAYTMIQIHFVMKDPFDHLESVSVAYLYDISNARREWWTMTDHEFHHESDGISSMVRVNDGRVEIQ